MHILIISQYAIYLFASKAKGTAPACHRPLKTAASGPVSHASESLGTTAVCWGGGSALDPKKDLEIRPERWDLRIS